MQKVDVEQNLQQLVIFQLNKQTFGVNIISVQEIIKMVPITRVPRTSEFVKGVINLRGKIIPVLDLYNRLNLLHPGNEADWRILIVETSGRVVGILVDGVSEVLGLSPEQIESEGDLALGLESKYIKGIGKREQDLIVILDLDKLLIQASDQENPSIKVV